MYSGTKAGAALRRTAARIFREGEAQQKGDRRKPPIEFSTFNMVANYYKHGPAARDDVKARIANPSSRGPDEPGKQVHIMVEVADDGTPPLVGCQRIVCNIK